MKRNLRLVKGMGAYPPFTVPGQTYEPLPPGTFAGSFQSVYREPRHAELPSSGGEFQFSGLNKARSRGMKRGKLGAVPVAHIGNTVCGMGDMWSDMISSLEKGAATAAGAMMQTQTAAPVVQAGQQVAIESAGSKAFAWAQTHWKQLAVGAVGTLAVVGGIFYFMGRKR